MDVKASLRDLRMSPRKVRLVVDAIRGLRATDAEARLGFVPRAAARPVLKLLQSAMANARNNFKLDPADLRVTHVVANQGATLKRFRPRAMGRAAPIRKRTTHIDLVLSDGKPTAPKAAKAPAAKSAKPAAPATAEKAPAKKPAARAKKSAS